jgi:aryl-alcohol dehydrogenase
MGVRATAAVLREIGEEFQLEAVELDEPRDDEVLVRVVASGMCHTDLMARDLGMTPPPVVLGHEGAGIVERVGTAVTRTRPGDHVVLSLPYCGACHACRIGDVSYCVEAAPRSLRGTRPDGSHTMQDSRGAPLSASFVGQSSFATHALVQEHSAVPIDPALPLELLGPLGCGVQTGAGTVLNELRPEPGSSIVVFGAGGVGLSAVMASALVGCAIIVAVDLVEERRQLALELGAHVTIDGAADDLVQQLQQVTNGGADYSVLTAPTPAITGPGIACLRARGACAIVAAGGEIPTSAVSNGKSVRGIVMGSSLPVEFIPMLAEQVRQGRLPVERMVHWYDFADINDAASDMEVGSSVKPILRMPAE